DGTPLVDNAFYIGYPDIFQRQAHVYHEIQTGKRRSARPADHHLDLGNVLAHDFETIDERRGHADGSAVPVDVENGDINAFTQFAYHIETLGRFDVFQVDATKGGLKPGNDINEFVRILLVDFDVENVNACELLEQNCLPFHNG